MMADTDPPRPAHAALLACLTSMHLSAAQATCAIETLVQRGFDRSAAELRVLNIAFNFWTPEQCRPAH
jgi:hypothetical protein